MALRAKMDDSLKKDHVPFKALVRGKLAGLRFKAEHDKRALQVIAPLAKIMQKKPTLDYLEMHVCDHCNLNCKGCSHFSPLFPPTFSSLQAYGDDLKELARLFSNIRTFRLMGGEPLLHPEVTEFLDMTRTAFPHATIALVTNGILLDKQPESFWNLLSRRSIRIDVSGYPIQLPRESLMRKASKWGVELRLEPTIDDFRALLVDENAGFNQEEMFRLCRKDRTCPFLYNGRLYHCATIPLAPILNEEFGTKFPLYTSEGIELKECHDGWKAISFLNTPSSWCARCALENLHTFSWAHTNRQPEEWLYLNSGKNSKE